MSGSVRSSTPRPARPTAPCPPTRRATAPAFARPTPRFRRPGWLPEVVDGDHDGGPALPLGGQHRRQHTLDRAHPTVERQFAEQQSLFEPFPFLLAVRRQHRRRERQVVDRAHLGQRRRRQRQRQPRHRPAVAAVGDGGPNAVARLLQCGVGQPDEMHAGKARGDVGLDLDDLALQPAHRHRERSAQRHQPTACRWVISGSRCRPMRTPMTSMRTAAQLPS